jgi:NAD(P)-dependent dehydrogenase (short-subunit alcohol dehydrogenase family)
MATKTTVLTGATSGLGEATALALAKQGHALYLLVRNTEKGNELKKQLIQETGNKEITIIKCDLADMENVLEATNELHAKLFNINVLINNAGGIFNEWQLSKDGFEMTFSSNHLGHFLLTMRLMPLLTRGHARIINLSSDAHKLGKPDFDNLQKEEGYSAMRAYGTAKLFNIYFAKSLAEKYADKGITAYSVHPGVVNTGFGTGLSGFGKWLLWLARPFMITAEKGAETTVYLATDFKIESKSGSYFSKKQTAKPAAIADDKNAREKLWELSEHLVENFFEKK